MEHKETRAHLACRFCIALYGLKPADIRAAPVDPRLLEWHIESTHTYLMPRAGESGEQARFRFMSTYGLAPRSAAQVLASLGPIAQMVGSMIEEKGPIIAVSLLRGP